MEAFEQRIEQVLNENSEWPGSADEMWIEISSQLQPEAKKRLWTSRPAWLGAAATATVLLAIMLHTVSTPVPPETPDTAEISPMRTYNFSMLAEPQVHHPGDQVEIALNSFPAAEPEKDFGLRLIVWQDSGTEQIIVSETVLDDEALLGRPSLTVSAPTEPGIYRFVVEGTIRDGSGFSQVFADLTIRVE